MITQSNFETLPLFQAFMTVSSYAGVHTDTFRILYDIFVTVNYVCIFGFASD